MAISKPQTWSNLKVLIAGCISLLGALTLLVLFIVFLSLSKPSYSDLNKFIFATLIVNFVLFAVYGVVCFMKDDSAVDYGIKTWTCCTVVCTTVATLTMISLHKSTERRLPTACLWTSVGVAGAIFLLNTLFCITDMKEEVPMTGHDPAYMMTSKDERMELDKTESDRIMRDKGAHEDSKMDSMVEPRKEPTVAAKKDAKVEPKVEAPPPEKSLRKEINPPRTSIIREYKKNAEGIKVTWERTHFILGIEAGKNMKKRWGLVISGLKSWVKNLHNGNVLISLFTFDSTFHLGPVCKSPSEFAEILSKGIEIRGGSEVSLSPAIETFADIIKSPDVTKNNALNFLHYGAILIGEEPKYPDSAVSKFLEFKKREGINFFFDVVSQVEVGHDLTKLATALEGVHYSVRKGGDLGLAFAEALERDPLKSL
eukprot:TRINITY_DN2382_c0_g3_i1.p1 TRINITY_DN2382_c0_g3~~TRINITY_DN2382_c0_g3_i1.p1  ORF type:complete len:426 (+),score=145.50 TRINITY_DN2382_c0_g3_i1:159-1436(+)